MAVAITSVPYRMQNVGFGWKVKMVFTGGTTVGTFTELDLTADKPSVIATAEGAATTVAISDGSPGVTVTVNADDTVHLDILKAIAL